MFLAEFSFLDVCARTNHKRGVYPLVLNRYPATQTKQQERGEARFTEHDERSVTFGFLNPLFVNVNTFYERPFALTLHEMGCHNIVGTRTNTRNSNTS